MANSVRIARIQRVYSVGKLTNINVLKVAPFCGTSITYATKKLKAAKWDDEMRRLPYGGSERITWEVVLQWQIDEIINGEFILCKDGKPHPESLIKGLKGMGRKS